MIRESRKIINIIVSVLLTLICFTLCISTHLLYAEIDNYSISAVLNRVYDAENYCMFLNPLLCYIVKGVSLLLPKTDALMIVVRVGLLAEVWAFFYLTLNIDNNLYKILCFVFIIFITQVAGCWCANFTLQAAFFSFGGLILIYVAEKTEKKIWLYVGILFAAIGFMLRREGVLLLLPFLLLEIIVDFYIARNTSVIKKFGIAISILVVLLGLQMAKNTSGEYKDGINYNKAMAIVDYPSFSWENICEKAEENGISQTEYEGVKNWRLADTENITAEKMKKISEIGITTSKPISVKGAVDVLKIMLGMFLSGNKKVMGLTVVSIILLIGILFSNINCLRKIEGLLSSAGAVIIIFYFTYIGRAPERVWVPVLLGLIGILLICMWRIVSERQNKIGRFMIVVCICVLSISFIEDILGTKHFSPQLAINSRIGADESLLDELYKQEDAVYLAGIDTLLDIDDILKLQGKLPTENYINHVVPEGGWKYGQVYFKNYLNRINMNNPAEALLLREHTYYLAYDVKPMLEYLQEHYSDRIVAEQINVAAGTFPVWKFSQLQ